MKIRNRLALIFVLSALLAAVISDCVKSGDKQSNSLTAFSSYIDIPGVTSEEIKAIEEIREKGEPFIYGMLVGTETFIDIEGKINGYTVLVCEWLTELFKIEFIPRHYTWFSLLDALESGEVSFSGELTANETRRKTYFMTDAIAQRSIKYFRVSGSRPFHEITQTRLPRYVLQEKNTITADVLNYAGGTFEPVYIHEYDEAYEILKSGKADALITEGVQEEFFDIYGDIEVSDFFPLIYSPVSLSTQNPKLEPFISVVQKALESGAIRHLNELYDHGYQEYLKNKLYLRLTDEEYKFIKENPVIPFAAEFDNYPISFYSTRHEEWQGICFDVLNQIETLTNLKFPVVNKENTQFHELVRILENGEAYMLSELVKTKDREGRFIWPDNSFMSDWSVLLSKVDYPNITVNRVYSARVAVVKGTAHIEFFDRWFPNHMNSIVFDSHEGALHALMKGEVDMVMSSYSALLYLINYMELPEFKANIMFDNTFESTFGINKDQIILCSIIDKALGLIDTMTISEQWRHRSYDYRLKITQARMPWLIGSIILSFGILALIAVLYIRTRRIGKQLENLVDKKTHELALQTATLTTLFDSIPDLIFTKNFDLKFMHCNKAMLNHFNRRLEDIIGKNDKNGLGLPGELARIYNKSDIEVIREGRTVTVEEHIPGSDGSNPLYETTKLPLMLSGETVGVIGISHDITRRKEIEEAALAASRSKSSFLANMSHEIRTPMNAILGVTEILTQHETLPPEIEEGLGKIYSSCDLLLGIINDILDFSKIEAGKLNIMPAQYKVASMINDSAHLNMMRIDSKPIEFELQIDENVPAKLFGDELRIKQILNNLLSNAFKYTDAGKVTLTVNVEAGSETAQLKHASQLKHAAQGESEQVLLVLSVRDTGVGMNKKQLGEMFDEYSRFNMENENSVEGTGLGLAITRRLLDLMNGEIHVESDPGKGSSFTVKLPQEKVDSEVLGKDVAANLRQFRMSYITRRKRGQIERDPMPYGSVLITDDVETNLYVAVGLMKLYMLQIDTAISGKDAIEKIKNGSVYDVIFMDHMMPEMDGIETTKQIRDLGYKAPVIALTANAVSGQADMFMQNGFDDFISKPIDIRQLNSVLNKFVRDKQPQEVIEAARRQKEEMNRQFHQHSDSLLIDSFVRDARKAVVWLEEQLRDNGIDNKDNLKKFTVTVHGIKSSLWNIGETSIAVMAGKLETAGREHDMDAIKLSAPGFTGELRALLNKIELKRGADSANPANLANLDENIEELLDKLQALQEMCADYDRKGALDILAKINSHSKETKTVLDAIMEYVLHSDFEEAKNAAAAYADNLFP